MHKPITIMFKMNGTKCNIKCAYCYELLDENKKSASKVEERNRLSSKDVIEVLKDNSYRSYVSVLFHGGEPLLTPRKDFEEIIDFINVSYGDKCEIQIQTNATLINNSWIELFKKIKCKFVVSISLDPVGFKNLRGIEYPDYIEKVWSKILLLQQSGIVVTIMAVAHKWNQLSFNEFVQQLVSREVRYLTINKYEAASFDNENFLSEKEYNSILMSVAEFWIKNELYREIEIQPLMSLFSNNKNRLCQYLSDNDKCNLFITIYPDKKTSCDHLYSKFPVIDENCNSCDIFSWCGSGCLSAIKDSSFCESRKNLKVFVEKVKNEN